MIRVVLSIQDISILKEKLKGCELNKNELCLLEELLDRRVRIELRRQEKLREKLANQKKAGEKESSENEAEAAISDEKSSTEEQNSSDTECLETDSATSELTEDQRPTEPSSDPDKDKNKKKPKGHGRNPHTVFKNADEITHALPQSISDGPCRRCGGDLLKQSPKIQIVIRGQPSFNAERHASESLICKCCRHSVVAPTPEIKGGIGKSVIYAPSASAMLLVLHYDAFLPFNRIDLLHKSWDVPFATSNQWEVVVEAYNRLKPLFDALITYAALNVLCIRFDDTGAIIWSIKRALRDAAEASDKDNKDRKGINSSCFLLDILEGRVTLFDTGLHHAAEIFANLLDSRDPEADCLVKVTDHANKNYISDNESTINGSCHTHIYLKFLQAKKAWPAEYAIVGEAYHAIYQNDLYSRTNKMSPEERLDYHQKNSTEHLNKIHEVCKNLLNSKKIDRSDIIWPAVSIVVNQWKLMTKFLEVPGVPLDTNDVERSLIQIVKFMAATLGYKNENGAEKGDLAMTLIATARNFDLEPWQYLRECLENYEDLAVNPDKYLPWNFKKRQQQPVNTGQSKVA